MPNVTTGVSFAMNSQVAYYVSRALDVNYAALAYAVYGRNEVSPDHAVARMYSMSRNTNKTVDTLRLVELRDQGYAYETIGDMVGMKRSAVFWRIKRWREKNGNSPLLPEVGGEQTAD